MIKTEDLSRVPEQHRRTVALWLAERAGTLLNNPHHGLIPAGMYQAASDALWGAATDLIDPLSEDTTVGHARDVLRHAGASMGRTPTTR